MTDFPSSLCSSSSLLPNGSIVLSKLLHGHVSRVRSIDVQSGRILSGSDDRSLKVHCSWLNFVFVKQDN